jgi:hypothetical protein
MQENNGMSGLEGSSIFSFLMNLFTDSYSGCTVVFFFFLFPPTVFVGSFVPAPSFFFLMIAILTLEDVSSV